MPYACVTGVSEIRTRRIRRPERATELIEQARARILSHFNASPDEYAVIFTPNATGACRLVGESYDFGPNNRFVLTLDNHNSVNGIREFARGRDAAVEYVPVRGPRAARRRRRRTRRAGRGTGRAVRVPGAEQLHRRPAPAGLGRPGARATATTCCSTRPPTSPPTGSTSAGSTPTSSRSAGTRSSATRPGSAASSPAARRSRGCGGRGSPAARSRR